MTPSAASFCRIFSRLAAGVDQVGLSAVDLRRMNDQVLQDAFGADAGFELGVLGRRGRRFADIGRRRHEPGLGRCWLPC